MFSTTLCLSPFVLFKLSSLFLLHHWVSIRTGLTKDWVLAPVIFNVYDCGHIAIDELHVVICDLRTHLYSGRISKDECGICELRAHIQFNAEVFIFFVDIYKMRRKRSPTSPLRVDELLDKTFFSYLLQFQNESCCRVDVFSGTPVYWDWYVLTKIKLIVTICNITLQHARQS